MWKNITAEVFEDNAGGLHIAVLEDDVCKWYFCDNDDEFAHDVWKLIIAGGNPIAEGWEGGEPDPGERYTEIMKMVEAHNGGANLIAELNANGAIDTYENHAGCAGHRFLGIEY